MAMAYEQTGDKEKARELLKEVADFNFNNVEYALLRKKAIKKIKSL
jgi:Tfp pilus assembly protein FimV